jgi:hypothetical protein
VTPAYTRPNQDGDADDGGQYTNDEKLAKEHGVRAIHGDAPYMRLEPDRVYEICLRSTGEVIITPGSRAG